MATQIQIKRGSTTPAGLTVGESAMNTSTNQIYLGGTGGTVLVGGEVTGGVDMGAGSAVSANRIPTQSGVYNYVRNSTVTSFNGATGAVGGVTTSAANTFTALQSFSAGISAAGGVTLAGTLQGTTANFTGLVSSAGGFSGAGTNLTNVAKLNTSNTFTSGSILTLNGVGMFPGRSELKSNSIVFVEGYDGGSTTLLGQPDVGLFNTVTLPPTTGTVALTNSTVASFNGRTGAVQGVSAAVGSTYLTVSGSTGSVTFTNTGVQTFNGLTGAVTGVTVGGTNVFTALNTFNAGISAAGSTFSSTTNTLDVIASTEGAGLRIAKAVTGANSRVGGIRLGRSGTTAQNTYLENSSGTFAVFNGVDNTALNLASLSSTAVTIGTTSATQLNLNCPGTVQIGDGAIQPVLHNQKFTLDGSTRFFTFGDSNGTTAGFMGINRAYNGLCADYALEVNSPTGKGLQLIYNDHTGAASNWVNMDVSSGGNYTLRPSGGLATVTGTLNVSAGVCAAGATFSGDIAVNGGDITTTSATATLYNTTATTVNIGNAASTVNLMGATASTQTGIGSQCYVKTGQTTTTTTAKQLIFSYSIRSGSYADTYFADIIITANYGNGVSGSLGSQITKMLVATSYSNAINHTEYGNVNTGGNLAAYTAEIVGSGVYIYATPTNGFTTVFNTYATLIKGTYGAAEEQ